MTAPSIARNSNRLLAALDADEFTSISEHMREVPLQVGECLFEPGSAIDRVLFPLSGAGSILSMLPDGRSVELTMVGREGILGLPFLFGVEVANWGTLVQLPGRALSMPAGRLRHVLPGHPRLERILHEFFAKWILMTHDRADSDEFPVTHEFLSAMLGVRRASITNAATQAQRNGAITYRRGSLKVLDRTSLESAACDCYGVMRQEFSRLEGVLLVR